jgi:hypothetical protein
MAGAFSFLAPAMAGAFLFDAGRQRLTPELRKSPV